MKNGLIRTSVWVGLLVTIPLMAVLFAASRLAGLPFSPFDLFNWIARILPGNVITLGIDAIVALIGGLGLGETSSTAKLIEQIMALAAFLVAGVGYGAASFVFLSRRGRTPDRRMLGVVLGLVAAVPMLLLFAAVNQTATTSPLASAAWLLIAFGLWGGATGWIAEQLVRAGEHAPSVEGRVPGISAGPPIHTGVINRRQFLVRVGNAAALITVAGAGLGALMQSGQRELLETAATDATVPEVLRSLPNAGAMVMPAPGTRPEYTPLADHYRIDISLVPPRIGAEDWVLPIHGRVRNPLALTLDDLRNNYPAREQYVTLSCISNRVGGDLIGTTLWTGVSLQQVLADADLEDDAAYLKITSKDGFHETVAIDLINQDERIMLCYDWDNQPLTVDHGFPLRIYIPDRYGMKQPKWITDIEVVSEYEEGYWVRRGWDEVARVKTTSVVDTVAANALIDADGQLLVPIGGIAYAGARGISAVEVRVDDGEWMPAQLRTPLSETTWVIWRYDWPFEAGEHRFAVRAYDGIGALQDETPRGARPSGATGLHSRTATLAPPEAVES